jgi:hypothetical protein
LGVQINVGELAGTPPITFAAWGFVGVQLTLLVDS